MNESQIVDELVRFLADGIKVFGEPNGLSYARKCIPMLEKQYGAAVANKIRRIVMKGLYENPGA